MAYEKRENMYHVTGDGGDYTVSPKVVAINADFTNVRCLSVGGIDGLSDDKSVRYKRVINGEWASRECIFEIITPDGEKRIRVPKTFHITVADFALSKLHHWKATGDMEEQIYLGLCLTQEWFDWLWNEIAARPNAPVGVRFHTMPWLAGVEASMWYEAGFRPVRFEEDKPLQILDADFYVGSAEAEKVVAPDDPVEEDNGAPPATFTEKIERELDTKSLDIWLKRIFWVLVLIAVVLALKLN